MLSLKFTIGSAGKILLMSIYTPEGTGAEVPIITDSNYLRLFLDAETISTTSDSRIFTDSSPNNFTITNNVRALFQSSFHPYGDESAWSLYIGASRLQVGTTSSFAFMHNTTAKFTYECWIFTYETDALLADNRSDFDGSRGITISLQTGKVRFRMSNGGAAGQDVVCTALTTSTLDSKWHHLAITYDQSLANENAKIYIDGKLNTTTNKSAWLPSSAAGSAYPLMLFGDAQNNDSASKCFNGYMSNLRITNDIVYTRSFTPPTTRLTASSATQLLTCQSSRLKDNSQNALTFASQSIRFVTPFFAVSRLNPFGALLMTSSSVGSVRFNNVSTEGLIIPADQQFVFGTGDFTIESWIYPLASSSGMIFGIVPTAAATKALSFSMGSGLRPQFFDRVNYSTASIAVQENGWSHVAAVRNNGTLTVYVNGLASVTATNTTDFNSSTQYFIGKNVNDTQLFNGYISNLRVMKGVAAYTENFVLPTEPLTVITGTSLLLNFNNGAVIDKAGQLLPIFFANTSTTSTGISSIITKNGNSSLYFPGGTADYIQYNINNMIDFLDFDFTIEFWINFQEFRSGAIVTNDGYSITQSAAGNMIFIHANTSSNRINLYLVGSGITAWDITSATSILASAPTLNTWYHLAVTRSGDTFRTFTNGVQVSTFSTSRGLRTSPSQLYIGGSRYTSAPGTNFRGYMDDFRIYIGYAKYTANFTPE